MGSSALLAERESWLVGKVCNFYRGMKLIYQSYKRLRAALESSLIRDTDDLRHNDSLNGLWFDGDNDVPR
jgi:prepilin-type processing-associated H-X9-DG protein